jgi:hypothetical protein
MISTPPLPCPFCGLTCLPTNDIRRANRAGYPIMSAHIRPLPPPARSACASSGLARTHRPPVAAWKRCVIGVSCARCGVVKSIGRFNIDRQRDDGLTQVCRARHRGRTSVRLHDWLGVARSPGGRDLGEKALL